MARKTVIRRACNYLPLSAEMASALELEDSAEGQVVVKPNLHQVSTEDLASAISGAQAAPAAEAETTVDGEFVNQETGEVSEAQASPPPPEAAPEKGTVDHLLWRIGQADSAQLADLITEATELPKDEPRRMEVGAAISARKKAVRS
jgi:hypothetical protein